MRLVTLLALVLGLTATAFAVEMPTSNVMPAKTNTGPGGNYDGTRVTGDTIGDPFTMTGVPFSDTGNTCTFANDYDEICPYSGSTSPDVVYEYVCTADIAITVDLCASIYDTKTYVYENDEFTLVGCNDDACSFQSLLENVALTAGNTYYIVVDGYGGSCGNYVLDVSEYEACVIECPAGAMPEGEPDCYPDYEDQYNGGCNVEPFPVFQVLEPSCDPIMICGTTGVFPFGTSTYRDTDWYELNLTETTTISLAADYEFGGVFGFVDGRMGCEGATAISPYALVGPCSPYYDLTNDCEPGTWWIFFSTSAWDPSYVCGSVYWLEITGYTGGSSPTESTTWGSIKGMFN